jgi:hypothetical protein
MKIKFTLYKLLLFTFLFSEVKAQQSVNTSGSDAVGIGGSVAFSIGLVAYTTNFGSNGSIAQGVQHAYEIYAVGITEEKFDIFLNAFPNPTPGILTIQISDYNNQNLSYQLLDMQGKILNSAKIVDQQSQIDMNLLANASYFINIINQENKAIKTFEIIKN